MSFDITHKEYKIFYARYFNKMSPLLSVFDVNLRDKIVLDLCGGSGRISLACLKNGCVLAVHVDKSMKMASPGLKRSRAMIFQGPLDEYLEMGPEDAFDYVFCEQAVNYWFNRKNVKNLASLMKPGGSFIFNTFNKKPPKSSVKNYRLGGRDYIEINWMERNVIRHRQGYFEKGTVRFHQNSFLWISPSIFRKILKPYFKVQIVRKEHTSYYQCVKNNGL